MADQSRLTWALLVSLLLHALLFSALPIVRRAQLSLPTPRLLDVDLAPAPKPPPPPPAARPAQPAPQPPPPIPVPKQQIVSPPEAGEEKEPEQSRFLSDRSNTVKEEMVRRGEPAAGNPDAKPKAPGPPPPPAKAEAPREPPKPAPRARAAQPQAPAASARPPVAAPAPDRSRVAALPNLDQLLPSASELARDDAAAAAPTPALVARAPSGATQRTDLLNHGDPWKHSGVTGGSLDLLPAVREGDITLLNTKAEQFAPFVRRVAVRVFENFRIMLRRSLDAGRLQSGQEFATIEAVMDRQGQLIAINPKDRSPSATLATDRNLQAATREGFFDRNPPPGAESNDGNIHFLFDARVAMMVEPGRGVVGYQAVFQAGLL